MSDSHDGPIKAPPWPVPPNAKRFAVAAPCLRADMVCAYIVERHEDGSWRAFLHGEEVEARPGLIVRALTVEDPTQPTYLETALYAELNPESLRRPLAALSAQPLAKRTH